MQNDSLGRADTFHLFINGKQATEGARDHGSNLHSDFAVCLCCWVDTVTGGASKPDDMWYYSVKYDDGEEEHKVGPARIFPNK